MICLEEEDLEAQQFAQSGVPRAGMFPFPTIEVRNEDTAELEGAGDSETHETDIPVPHTSSIASLLYTGQDIGDERLTGWALTEGVTFI